MGVAEGLLSTCARFETLKQTLRRSRSNTSELLLVLERARLLGTYATIALRSPAPRVIEKLRSIRLRGRRFLRARARKPSSESVDSQPMGEVCSFPVGGSTPVVTTRTDAHGANRREGGMVTNWSQKTRRLAGSVVNR